MLGICLGAQVMFSKGREHKELNGLNFIKGQVLNLKEISKNKDLTIPHIGWSVIKFRKHKIFNDIENLSKMYFIHSFNFVPEDESTIFATTPFYNCLVNSVSIKDNLIACQFHPEKSGSNGLKFLSNFSKLN